MKPKYQATIKLNDCIHRVSIVFARPIDIFAEIKKEFEQYEGFSVFRGTNLSRGGVAGNVVELKYNPNYEGDDVVENVAKFLGEHHFSNILFERDIKGGVLRGTLADIRQRHL